MKKLVVISLFLASINLIYAENTSVPTTVALKKDNRKSGNAAKTVTPQQQQRKKIQGHLKDVQIFGIFMKESSQNF